jgi:hypothetical protein
VGDDRLAAGTTDEGPKQGSKAFAHRAESPGVSLAQSSQEQQSSAADVDDARCQDTHAADEQSQQS